MATPASSATSPSPALSYAVPVTNSDHISPTHDPLDDAERDERRRKLLQRTELAKLTRALRSTLALASYKAKNNLSTVPLRTLEVQIARDAHLSSAFGAGASSGTLASPGASSDTNHRKRKYGASIGASYTASPLSQHFGEPGSLPNSPRQGGLFSSAMPPPANSYSGAQQSLFASILAPPPSKRTRTIHNPEAPLMQASNSSHSQASSRSTPKKGTRAEKGKDQQTINRKTGHSKVKPTTAPPESPRGKGKGRTAAKQTAAKSDTVSSKSGGRRKRAGSHSSTHTRSSIGAGADSEIVNDTDIKAAETLTEIFFSRGGANSPHSSSFSQSSTAGSGSMHFNKLSQGSSASISSSVPSKSKRKHTRTGSALSASTVTSPTSSQPSSQTLEAPAQIISGGGSYIDDMEVDRNQPSSGVTTPRSNRNLSSNTATTGARGSNNGNGGGADSELANMLVMLANSPSPARPTNLQVRDREMTRSLHAAGRVLFPSASGSSSVTPTSKSSIDADVRLAFGSGPASPTSGVTTPTNVNTVPSTPVVSPPTPTSAPPTVTTFAQSLSSAVKDEPSSALLPPPPSPTPVSASARGETQSQGKGLQQRGTSGEGRATPTLSNTATPSTVLNSVLGASALHTPGGFDMADYVNITPSSSQNVSPVTGADPAASVNVSIPTLPSFSSVAIPASIPASQSHQHTSQFQVGSPIYVAYAAPPAVTYAHAHSHQHTHLQTSSNSRSSVTVSSPLRKSIDSATSLLGSTSSGAPSTIPSVSATSVVGRRLFDTESNSSASSPVPERPSSSGSIGVSSHGHARAHGHGHSHGRATPLGSSIDLVRS